MKSLKSTAATCIATLALLAGGLTLTFAPTPASAAPSTPCGTTGTFTSPNECSYTSQVTDDTFTVPSGVTSLHVVTAGASGTAGGPSGSGGTAGSGAQVTADVPVTPGDTEYVEVGTNGGNGGPGGSYGVGAGGNGGGLSGIYTCSGGATTASCAVVVAGGGGGGGGNGGSSGNNGGSGGVSSASCNPGDPGTEGGVDGRGAAGGYGGECESGGSGGNPGTNDGEGGSVGGSGLPGGPGAGGPGGGAISGYGGGGGGGAGYYGGGGGGGVGGYSEDGGGGGGGSSFAEASASNVATVTGPGTPSVIITWTAAPTISSASISGTATVGQTLSTSSAGVTGIPSPVESYQWYSGTTPVGTNASTYVIQPSDAGASITATITETNSAGSSSAISPSTAAVTEAPSIASSRISGPAQLGQTLSASSYGVTGVPSPVESYQWYSNGTPVGTNASTYVIQPSDVGASIKVVVTETNSAGSASATSLPTGAVSPGTGVLTLSGTPITSDNGNTYTGTLDTSSNFSPDGALAISDSDGSNCASSSWADQGSDGHGGELYAATCSITNPEHAGDTATATYTGSDYEVSASNTLTVGAAPAALYLNADPTTSDSGNSYTIIFDASTDVAPSGTTKVTDSNNNSCTASASAWADDGPDASGGEYFIAQCSITQPESGGQTAYASYSGTDYNASPSSTVAVAAAGAGLSLSGSPITSDTGNTYQATLDAPTDVTPSGTVTVTDSNASACQATLWSDAGTDGSGGELFTASCAITSPESGGDTVTATYSGSDYTAATSNKLSVAAGSGVLSINETATTSASGNAYTIIFDASADVVPTGVATVTDSNGNSCTSSYTGWSPGDGSDGAGGEYFSAGCYITQPESGGDTVSVSYAGADYTAAPSSDYTIAAVPATLSLSGAPVPSPTGNTYKVTLDSPTDVTPGGTATVTDSASGTCQTSSWSDAGPDGTGGELFSAPCSITSAEAGGDTVSATYSGSDYTTSTSNVLTVNGPATNTVAPQIAGTAGVGQVLSTTTGTWTDDIGSFSYQWYSCTDSPSADPSLDSNCTAVGTNTDTYTLQTSDSGHYIAVDVTDVGTDNSTTTAFSNVVGPVTDAPTIATATISGTDTVGQTLTAGSTGVTGSPAPTETYQWYSNGSPVGTNQTYVLQNSDIGNVITVKVTETNVSGSASATSTGTSAIAGIAPTIATATISGTDTVGQTLTAGSTGVTGTPTPTETYQWYSSGSPVGVDSSTYILQSSDIGNVITVKITETNVAGSASATSTGTSAISGIAPTIATATISGVDTVGQTLTAGTTGVTGDPNPTATYQWYSNGSPVGTDSSTYVLQNSDIGNVITVKVTETNVAGSASATSTSTPAIAGIAPTISTATISGTDTVGQTLTAGSTGATGTPAPTETYQWYSNGSPVGTGKTYILQPSDIGNVITVKVTETNVAGSANATSTGTSVIVGVPTTDHYSYNPAGGAPTPSSGSGTNGTAITLAPAPTLSGYTFAGWSDGSATYGAGASYTLNSGGNSITFTALWTATGPGGPGGGATTYTVTYIYDGGIGPASATFTVGGSPVTLPTPTLAGSTFTGWYTASSGGTLIGKGGDSYSPSAAVTLYAQWTTNAATTNATTTKLSVSSVRYGAEGAEKFSVTVTGQPGAGSPKGTITIYSSSTALCSAVLVGSGSDSSSASCSPTSTKLAHGVFEVFATYTPASGATNTYTASKSAATSLTVSRDTSSISVGESRNGVAEVFRVHVTTGHGEAVRAGERVIVRAGSASCVAVLRGGRGQCTIGDLKAGTYRVSARYTGDANLGSRAVEFVLVLRKG